MFGKLFEVFSKREQSPVSSTTRLLTDEFRNRVIMLVRDLFRNTYGDLLENLHNQATYLYGKLVLSNSQHHRTPADDMLHFIISCKDEHFLDVIELIFRSNLPGITYPENKLIPCINEFFRIDDLPYYLTGYSTEESESSYYGTPTKEVRISEFPRIIRRDSELIHKLAVEPVLSLLKNPEFQQVNDEFLKALEDHRKGDFRDCLTKCGSAFESAMKVLCHKNSITYNKDKDTALPLLKALLEKGQLEAYWEQPLIIIATLRNRLSSSHGAGTQQRIVPEHVATYAVNATASAILFLISEFQGD